MIKRAIFNDLKEHLSQKEITFIVGPRQAGKTTIMMFLKDFLEKNGDKTLFLNLDIERDKAVFLSQENLIRKIELEVGSKKAYVFIDEIQRKENAGIFLKGIYDMNLPYKFIVSGSGSVELKEKIQESLVGRKRIFELNTLNFLEFVNFKTDYKYEHKIAEFFEVEKEKTLDLLNEYLNFGGYPRAVLEKRQEDKIRVLNEIYQSYLEKDISYLLGIKKTENLTHLLKIVASQIGSLTNFSEISNTLGISVKTVKNYLFYLEKTFILKKITPYFKNIRKEITKAPVFYFCDLGLRNFILDKFNVSLENSGFIFENFIYLILQEKIQFSSSHIHFWRTKDGSEVDFVIDKGESVIPIEVKARKIKEVKLPRSFKNFINRYRPKKAFLVNLELKEKINFEKIGTDVYFIPFYDLQIKNLF